MNASESNSSKLAGGQSTPPQSVEDELSRFFAETSANERKQPPVPVKGSIMNFFKPPAARQTTAPLLASAALASLLIPSNTKSINQKPHLLEQEIAWSCESCTFINATRKVKVEDWLPCEMCGAIYIHKDSQQDDSIRAVSPPAFLITNKAGKQKDAGKVIDLIGDSRRPRRRNQESPEVILIDLGEADCQVPVTPRQPKRVRRTLDAHPSDVIDIDMEGKQDANRSCSSSEMSVSRCVVTPTQRRILDTNCLLNFAVSKNSGRVSIHHADSGESFHFNFDINELVTKETADSMLSAEVKRSSLKVRSSAVSPTDIKFCDDSVKQGKTPSQVFLTYSTHSSSRFRILHLVFCSLNFGSNKSISHQTEEQCCKEIKAFITGYVSLREVEKKALQEWSQPVSSVAVKQSISRIMTSSVTTSCTKRYVGGAKERARAYAKAGNATSLDVSVLSGNACAWCAGPLSDASLTQGVDSTYCSQECAENGRLGRGGMFASTRVRAQVFGLEGGVCQKCGIDAHALFVRISALEPPERLNALCNANWQLPKSGPALERLLQRPKEGDFWQVCERCL
jgi:hypothetical protein